MSKDTNIQVNFPVAYINRWRNFINSIRFENRFTLSGESEEFVKDILLYAEAHKVKTYREGRTFYRSRINDLNSNTPHLLSKMGAPPKKLAGHGRLNPKGIPYLYLSSTMITAVSEVRPWVGCSLTVAEFEVVGDVKLVNFSKTFFKDKKIGVKRKQSESVWDQFVTWMFSSPFDPRDDTAYIPTQYISEKIKGQGFDGIIYDSALNPEGYNVTLFDPTKGKPIKLKTAKIHGMKIEPKYKEIK